MPCATWLAAVLRAPVSFQEKETDAVWRSEVCREVKLLQNSELGPLSAAWADWSSRHPSLLGSDSASRRTLIALGEEPPRECRSLQGSGYLGWRCQRQRSVRQFFIPTRKGGQVSRSMR